MLSLKVYLPVKVGLADEQAEWTPQEKKKKVDISEAKTPLYFQLFNDCFATGLS